MQNRLGQQFGNYRLIRLLGRGGFAEVYLGEHVYMRSQAAVKVLYGPLTPSSAQNFLEEARTLASLEHPHIVGIKEFDIKEDIPFLVINYAPNGTLRQRHAKGQPVPLGTIVSYVLQIASALQYAHDRHIVHRDLKPENMLINQNNNILLSDFGIAVLTHSSHSSVARGPAGTYFYMAPEQITGKALPASDQYALGITVYEWLCGEVPFAGSVTEITAKHLHIPPPPFRDKGIGIEPQVEAVIRRALEKDPQQRFTSVQECALALQSSSQAQQSNRMYIPAPSSYNSIFPSPSPKTPDFTDPTPPVLIPPRLTPHIPPTVESPTSSGPSPQLTPTQPASPAAQRPKTGFPRLATIVISVVLLFIVIGSAFASQIIFGLGATTTPTPRATTIPTPGATVTSTPEATATPTTEVTATPTPKVFAVDPNEINTVRGFADGFCHDLFWKDHQHAYNNMMSVKYIKDHPDENQFAQEPFFSGGGCEYNTPLIVNNAWRVVFHIGSVNSPTNYTTTIIHDPGSNGDLRVNAIQ